MITYGFFNSVDGDRVYNADQMSEYFDGLVTDGIYQNIGGALEVQASSGMSVNVSTGRAMVDCKWINNDAVLPLEITASHPTLNRYTAVVVRLDFVNRLLTITSKDGTPAATPTKPTMQNDSSAKELCLAYIYIGAGAVNIVSANIEDMRASDSCGWVTGIVNANTQIKRFSKTYTVSSAGAVSIPLDMTSYIYAITDIVQVYINGLFCIQGSDYTLNTSGSVPNIVISGMEVGSVIRIEVLR